MALKDYVIDFVWHIIAIYIALFVLMPDVIAESEPVTLFESVIFISAVIFIGEVAIEKVTKK
jgi:hypothetical protein